MSAKLIILAVVGLIIGAILFEAWLKRGKRPRPLAHRMRDGLPETGNAKKEVPLGMEATDLEIVENAQKLNERSALASDNVSRQFRR